MVTRRERRRQAFGLIGLTVTLVCSMAQAPTTQASGMQWFYDQLTFPNILAAAVLFYHFGVIHQQMKADRADIKELLDWKAREDGGTGIYARKDVIAVILENIQRELTEIKTAIDERKKRGTGGTA